MDGLPSFRPSGVLRHAEEPADYHSAGEHTGDRAKLVLGRAGLVQRQLRRHDQFCKRFRQLRTVREPLFL